MNCYSRSFLVHKIDGPYVSIVRNETFAKREVRNEMKKCDQQKNKSVSSFEMVAMNSFEVASAETSKKKRTQNNRNT